MKIIRIFLAATALLLVSSLSFSQDLRTTETKVADLLGRLPANDNATTDRLMAEIIGLGEYGIRMICDQIIPAGTGDDTKARFAAASLSRYLSANTNPEAKTLWEKICLGYAASGEDYGVKDFFIRQLQLTGSSEAVFALKDYLMSRELCNPALAVIRSVGGLGAEEILAEALKNPGLPCAAGVMNALALMRSPLAVNEYIRFASDINVNTRASAFNALAQSGSPLAYPVLHDAAKDVGYRWEHTGATASLLEYARNAGLAGDLKTMDRICNLVMAKCNDKTTIQNKSAALKIYTGFHGTGAMKVLFKAAGHPDKTYREAAFQASLLVPGKEIINKWLDFYPKAESFARPGIIYMLGSFGDELSLPLVRQAMNDADPEVRAAAVTAVSKISGNKAIPDLRDFLLHHTGAGDQESVKKALMTVAGTTSIGELRSVLGEAPDESQKTIIELMAWNSDNGFFNDVLPFTDSDNPDVSLAAFKALAALASSENQLQLTDLMAETDDPDLVRELQSALARAASMTEDPEKRSELLLKALAGDASKEKIIPVLARTGGKEALAYVLKEFEAGQGALRDICFETLTSWRDHSASSALFEILASGNKTFGDRAFNAYVAQTGSSPLTDEQKLLLLKKVMPFATGNDRRNLILTAAGKLKTYQALFFAAPFLDDPGTSAAAARAVMFIALPTVDSRTGMYGNNVREILEKTLTCLAGPESEYEREMVSRYIDGMLPDEGFVPMFNGKDLSGWQGLVENPLVRSRMRRSELERRQAEADVRVPSSWTVRDGCIWFNGEGDNLCTIREYGDFEMLVDWVISRDGDSGIYLRGTPQVQIWDTSRSDVEANVGSGGLYNNQVNPSKPLQVADNPVGEWNSFRILMTGEKVSVWLNGILVVDNVTMENYWDRSIPIFPKGPVELQAHGTNLGFRDLYIREIRDEEFNLTTEEKTEGFKALFNGRNLDNWIGNKESYIVGENKIVVNPGTGSGGNLYTAKEYSDFVMRFEFMLTPGANNGLGIRTPPEGDAAYVGMELQILDNNAPVYANLQPYQYHGSVYGVIPAKREFLNPVGEWNYQEVRAEGTRITVTLNGTVIVDGDIADARDNGTMDHNDHPGLKNTKGHIGFLGHGSEVHFRNIRIKELPGIGKK
ncbi:MAG: DUF1080 domain-containing protein [Bacteroidales bacterium]|jgi:HEAT repeat protein|nr:DUF1080 domain-containing protein [Bacteroidales bacterium]